MDWLDFFLYILDCLSILDPQQMEHHGQLFLSQAAELTEQHDLSHVNFNLIQVFFLDLVKIPFSHKASFAGKCIDEVLTLQFLIGSFCGDHADLQFFCQLANRGKSVTYAQFPCGNQFLHMVNDLLVDGLVVFCLRQ